MKLKSKESRFDNRWEPEWKETLVLTWPVDGPRPRAGSPSVKDFAAAIGVTPKAVVSMWEHEGRKTMGSPRKVPERAMNGHQRWTKEDNERILAVIEGKEWPGNSYWKVLMLAEQLGRTPMALYTQWTRLVAGINEVDPHGNGKFLEELHFLRDYLNDLIGTYEKEGAV